MRNILIGIVAMVFLTGLSSLSLAENQNTAKAHKLNGKGDDGAVRVNKADIAESDNWNYGNNPNTVNPDKEGVFDPGGWGVKPEHVDGETQDTDHIKQKVDPALHGSQTGQERTGARYRYREGTPKSGKKGKGKKTSVPKNRK
jgi:hypothetical protein